MKTEYLGAVIVPDGFCGATIRIHLCYDPESLHTIGVWTGGIFRTQVPPAIDVNEAKWIIANHPACERLRA